MPTIAGDDSQPGSTYFCPLAIERALMTIAQSWLPALEHLKLGWTPILPDFGAHPSYFGAPAQQSTRARALLQSAASRLCCGEVALTTRLSARLKQRLSVLFYGIFTKNSKKYSPTSSCVPDSRKFSADPFGWIKITEAGIKKGCLK